MARKTHRRPSPELVPSFQGTTPTLWPRFLLTALVAACLGAGIMYLVLRPALQQSTQTRQMTGQAALALGNRAFDQQDWPSAVRFYSQAIASGVDGPDIRTDLGTAYRSLHQPQKALEEYAAAQKLNPEHENSLLNQGIVYASDLGDAPKAVAVWKQYLARFPQGQHVADVRQFIAETQAHSPLVSPVKPASP
ncbi:MAG: tetratricopeptide repeat protein [Armatimonadota bacterium]|nr:tetratricopeptide repeat protein [Armatimonadota bacterium]